VEVWVEEVRVTGTVGLQNTQSPNGTDPTNNGSVSIEDLNITPVNNVTGDLTSGLPNPPGQTPSTSIPSPNIGPAFYTADNIPLVPNEVAQLNAPQQTSAIAFGENTSALDVSGASTYALPAGPVLPAVPASGLIAPPPTNSVPVQYMSPFTPLQLVPAPQ